MFVSFLHPFRYRSISAPHLWVLYKQVSHFSPEEIIFIGSREYFLDPESYREEGRFELSAHSRFLTEYEIPQFSELKRYETHIFDQSIFSDLENSGGTLLENMAFLLNHRYLPLENVLKDIFEQILSKHEINSIFSWCNVPSLSEVGRRHSLPVVHNELGPLRKQHYHPTAYFDFSGVNGRTAAKVRFKRFLSDGIDDACGVLDRVDLLRTLGCCTPIKATIDENEKIIGVPLQVEDDSNLIAFSNGFDNDRLLMWARNACGDKKLLVRRHPAGHRNYSGDFFSVDRSASSIEFLDRCSYIATINSSVGYEAMLRGRKTCILGDSPVSFIAANSPDFVSPLSAEQELLALNFIAFGYLIPYEFLYDQDYLAWRLDNPSEGEIYRFHQAYYREKNRFEESWFKYKGYDSDRTRRGLLKYEMARRYDTLETEVIRKDRDQIVSTLSWRITRPLRSIGAFIQSVLEHS